MGYELDAGGHRRLDAYFATIGVALDNKTRRASFATYAMGLLGSADRKSAEPIAAIASAAPETCEPAHHRLLRFLRDSPWSDREVRRIAAKHAVEAMATGEPIQTWIIDDTGVLKQGTHSVGVQRQYTGSAGKIANCQLGVSLSIATRSAHVPIDFELYLPDSWTSNPARRKAGHIPEDVAFETKEDLALRMVARAVEDELPGNIVLADAWYGRSHRFRQTVRDHGLHFAVGINPTQKMWRLDALERRIAGPQDARAIATQLGAKAFRRVTWRDGTMPQRHKLSARFAFVRIKVAHDDGREPSEREPLWLIIEWRKGEAEPTHFALTTLRRQMRKKQIVRLFKERYRTERVYEEMKVELGLDHFEGRSYPGWHHHVSVAICCYAFVVTERMRHFPPSARRHDRTRSHDLAA